MNDGVQFVGHCDLTAPITRCAGNANVDTDDPAGAAVEFSVSAFDDGAQPLRGPGCVPPGGSFFSDGTTAAPPWLTLTWDCQGILQCGSEVSGPRSDLPGVTSPHATDAIKSQKFLRDKIS